MNIKKIKDGNYAGKTYTISYEDIVEAAEALINSAGFGTQDHFYFKDYLGLVLPVNVVDAALKEAYRNNNSKKNVSDSRVSDDDDAFDEYFDYSEEAMEENDKVNDKCGGKRKVKDDNKSCQDLVDEINDWMNEETLTHVQVSDFLEMEGLVCEETAKLFGDNIEIWFYPNEPVGKYGKKGHGIEVDFNGYDELIDVVLVDRH